MEATKRITIENNNGQIRKNEILNIQFKVMVHTLNIKSKSYLSQEEDIRSKSYIKDFKMAKGYGVFYLNLNKLFNQNLYSLYELEAALNFIQEELLISEYEFERVDIAVDSQLKFEKCYKLNLYTVELFDKFLNRNSSCKNYHKCTKSSIYAYNRNYTLCIYDKDLESKGKDGAETRFELRFRRIKKGYDIKNLLEDFRTILDALPFQIDKVNTSTIQFLHQQYQTEQTPEYESRSISLSAFVNKWSYDFLNLFILTGVYELNMKGDKTKWLSNYRKKRNITLYTKNELRLYLNQIKKALKEYVKST